MILFAAGIKFLVLESCSHHPIEDDIGRVKIPDLIRNYTGKDLIFEHYAGHDFPSDILQYSFNNSLRCMHDKTGAKC